VLAPAEDPVLLQMVEVRVLNMFCMCNTHSICYVRSCVFGRACFCCTQIKPIPCSSGCKAFESFPF